MTVAARERVVAFYDMTPDTETIDQFFARYTAYLSAGDLDGLADIYNYPALAVTAGGCAAISDPQQTRDFLAQGQSYYRSRRIAVTMPLDAG